MKFTINTTPAYYSKNNGTIQIKNNRNKAGNAHLEYSINGGLDFQNTNTFTDLSGGKYDIVIKRHGEVLLEETIVLPKILSELQEKFIKEYKKTFNQVAIAAKGLNIDLSEIEDWLSDIDFAAIHERNKAQTLALRSDFFENQLYQLAQGGLPIYSFVPMKDSNGNPIYETNKDGSEKLDQNGRRVRAVEKIQTGELLPNDKVIMFGLKAYIPDTYADKKDNAGGNSTMRIVVDTSNLTDLDSEVNVD